MNRTNPEVGLAEARDRVDGALNASRRLQRFAAGAALGLGTFMGLNPEAEHQDLLLPLAGTIVASAGVALGTDSWRKRQCNQAIREFAESSKSVVVTEDGRAYNVSAGAPGESVRLGVQTSRQAIQGILATGQVYLTNPVLFAGAYLGASTVKEGLPVPKVGDAAPTLAATALVVGALGHACGVDGLTEETKQQYHADLDRLAGVNPPFEGPLA
ncbi:hypothetical protein CR970_02135 [Candidatus Saccharibacteria bacterium]|nr:MAG: hypothetical protein CR970_02135 [Candidatus Saccharibacteria bacterium]